MEVVMIFYAPLILIAATLVAVPAVAQTSQLGPSGDFRVEGRSGTAPTAGPPGGPSLPPGPAQFRDNLGGRSPDEILKSIDKDLGKGSEFYGSGSSSHTLNLERELSSPADKISK